MDKYIEVSGTNTDELLRMLERRLADVGALMQILGEDGTERVKERFDSSTGPDGVRWAPNSPATIAAYIRNRGGKAPRRKGQAFVKKPLIGESQALRQIHYQADDDSVVIGSSRVQAFMLHFGGTKAAFPHLWGDIPARPFFPMQPDGSLYPSEEDAIVDEIQRYLTME